MKGFNFDAEFQNFNFTHLKKGDFKFKEKADNLQRKGVILQSLNVKTMGKKDYEEKTQKQLQKTIKNGFRINIFLNNILLFS